MDGSRFEKFCELVFDAGLENEFKAILEEIREQFGIRSESRCIAFQNCKYFSKEYAFTPGYFLSFKEYPKFTRNHRIRINRQTTRHVLVANEKRWLPFEHELDSMLASISSSPSLASSKTSIVPDSWLTLLVDVGLIGCNRFRLDKSGSLEHPLQFFLKLQDVKDSPFSVTDFLQEHGIDGSIENLASIDSGWKTQVFDPIKATVSVLDALLRRPAKTKCKPLEDREIWRKRLLKSLKSIPASYQSTPISLTKAGKLLCPYPTHEKGYRDFAKQAILDGEQFAYECTSQSYIFDIRKTKGKFKPDHRNWSGKSRTSRTKKSDKSDA